MKNKRCNKCNLPIPYHHSDCARCAWVERTRTDNICKHTVIKCIKCGRDFYGRSYAKKCIDCRGRSNIYYNCDVCGEEFLKRTIRSKKCMICR